MGEGGVRASLLPTPVSLNRNSARPLRGRWNRWGSLFPMALCRRAERETNTHSCSTMLTQKCELKASAPEAFTVSFRKLQIKEGEPPGEMSAKTSLFNFGVQPDKDFIEASCYHGKDLELGQIDTQFTPCFHCFQGAINLRCGVHDTLENVAFCFISYFWTCNCL